MGEYDLAREHDSNDGTRPITRNENRGAGLVAAVLAQPRDHGKAWARLRSIALAGTIGNEYALPRHAPSYAACGASMQDGPRRLVRSRRMAWLIRGSFR